MRRHIGCSADCCAGAPPFDYLKNERSHKTLFGFHEDPLGDIMIYPLVSIILLNWNGWSDTIECLESLYQLNYPNYILIVVDNDSTNDSIEKIKEYAKGNLRVKSKFVKYYKKSIPLIILEGNNIERESNVIRENEKRYGNLNKKLILIKNKKNYGFAKGSNIGIKYALKCLNPEYILLLNNDTIVYPGFLSDIVNSSINQNRVGIIGPKINYYSDPLVPTPTGLPGFIGKSGFHRTVNPRDNKPIECDFITGCCYLIPTDIAYRVSFDEDFFLLWEDMDFCCQIRNLDLKIIYIPNIVIYHKLAQSRGAKSKISTYYENRNMLLYLKKNRKLFSIYIPIIYFILLLIPGRILIYVLNNDYDNIKAMFKGIRDFVNGDFGEVKL